MLVTSDDLRLTIQQYCYLMVFSVSVLYSDVKYVEHTKTRIQ